MGTRRGIEMFSDADGRSTETEQRSQCPADCPNGGSGDWEGPAVDDSLTDGTSRRLVPAERRERRCYCKHLQL